MHWHFHIHTFMEISSLSIKSQMEYEQLLGFYISCMFASFKLYNSIRHAHVSWLNCYGRNVRMLWLFLVNFFPYYLNIFHVLDVSHFQFGTECGNLLGIFLNKWFDLCIFQSRKVPTKTLQTFYIVKIDILDPKFLKFSKNNMQDFGLGGGGWNWDENSYFPIWEEENFKMVARKKLLHWSCLTCFLFQMDIFNCSRERAKQKIC